MNLLLAKPRFFGHDILKTNGVLVQFWFDKNKTECDIYHNKRVTEGLESWKISNITKIVKLGGNIAESPVSSLNMKLWQ